MSREPSLLGLETAGHLLSVTSHGHRSVCVLLVSLPPLKRNQSLWLRAPFSLMNSIKALSPHMATLGIRSLAYGFWGTHFSP